MRSVPLAMIWEMLWRGRYWLPAAALAANLLPVILLTALKLEGAIIPGDESAIVMHIVLLQINTLLFAAAVFHAQGHPSRLYAFPLSTPALVAWHLLPAMAAVALESLASTALVNALFQLEWPLWGPALFVAVAVAAVHAALWYTEKTAWLLWAFSAVGAVLGLWLKSRYGALFSHPSRQWSQLTPAEVATLLAFAVAAFWVAMVAVGRNRRGETLPALGIVAWLKRAFDPAPDGGGPFRDPQQAQFWFEWRQKGSALPAGVLSMLVLGAVAWLIFSRRVDDLFDGIFAGGGLFSLLGLICGLVMGNSGPNDSNFEMGNFQATRPITNTQLARTILKTAAKSLLMAWAIWDVAFAVVYLLLLATRGAARPTFANELGWWYIPVSLLGPWIVVGLTASAALCGHWRPFLLLFCGAFVLWIGAIIAAKWGLSRQAQLQVGRAALEVIAAAFVLATAWAFAAARRRALIASPTAWFAAGAWAAASAIVVLDWSRQPVQPLHACALAVGLLALAVAPLATAPLAVEWNRNR